MAQLVVTATEPLFRAQDTRADELAGLYLALGRRGVTVDVVSLTRYGTRAERREVAENVTEVRVPRSPLHAHVERELRRTGGDWRHLLATQHRLTAAFVDELERAGRRAGAMVAFGPHIAPLLNVWTGARIILDSRGSARAQPQVAAEARRAASLALVSGPGGAEAAGPVPTLLVQDASDLASLVPERRPGPPEPVVVVFADHLPDEVLQAAQQHTRLRFVVDGIPPPPRIPGFAMTPLETPQNVDARPVRPSTARLVDTLGVATAAVGVEATGPQLLLAAAAGAPLLPGPRLKELGLEPAVQGRDLATSLERLLRQDPEVTIRFTSAARSAALQRTWDRAADHVMADTRFASLLAGHWRPAHRPLRRRFVA